MIPPFDRAFFHRHSGLLLAGIQKMGKCLWISAFTGLATLAFVPGQAIAGAGKNGFEVLNMDAPARQAAMAGTGTAEAVDADGYSRNPAVLGLIRSPEAGLSQTSFPLSVTLRSGAYVHPRGRGAWGVRMTLLGVEGMKGFDAGGSPTGEVKAQDSVLSAGYGRMTARGNAWGAAVKQVRQTIGNDSASVLALDAGWARSLARWPVRLTAALRNLGSRASFIDESVALPRSTDFGVAFRGFHGALRGGVELRRGSSGDNVLALGVEGWLRESLAVRAGYDTTEGMGDGWGLGMGFRIAGLRLDYAFQPKGEGFDPGHRISLTYRFRSPGEKAYQEGLALSQSGRYAEAIYKFKEALDEDPRLNGAVRGLRESAEELERQTGDPR